MEGSYPCMIYVLGPKPHHMAPYNTTVHVITVIEI